MQWKRRRGERGAGTGEGSGEVGEEDREPRGKGRKDQGGLGRPGKMVDLREEWRGVYSSRGREGALMSQRD